MLTGTPLVLLLFSAAFVRSRLGLSCKFGLALVFMLGDLLLSPARARPRTCFLCSFIEEPSNLVVCPSALYNRLSFVVFQRSSVHRESVESFSQHSVCLT